MCDEKFHVGYGLWDWKISFLAWKLFEGKQNENFSISLVSLISWKEGLSKTTLENHD